MKIQNFYLKGIKKAYVCGEVVDFDQDGIADMTDEQAYKSALSLANFVSLEEPVKDEGESKKEKTAVKENSKKPEVEDTSEEEVKVEEEVEEKKPAKKTTKK